MLKLCVIVAIHNPNWMKINLICLILDHKISNIDIETHPLFPMTTIYYDNKID